ncbi:acyl transferase/acyl hydrolase/lysophospholipase [Aspergillus arachidicola]|uniref:Acyl transferase/acyl hydrolase/lysophospholipase n=1 Tax=Aspergillus arachidicola TaxID=656916 RepID=A0A5N6XQM5_9EURO|nr:acyl transferase/acyl hydrolase/lysophospholipase [Aspergillus arachidicola]
MESLTSDEHIDGLLSKYVQELGLEETQTAGQTLEASEEQVNDRQTKEPQPVEKKPAAKKKKPATEEPATEEPATEEPATKKKKPATKEKKPATKEKKPATKKPATKKPATKKGQQSDGEAPTERRGPVDTENGYTVLNTLDNDKGHEAAPNLRYREKTRFQLKEGQQRGSYVQHVAWAFSDVFCIRTASVSQAVKEICSWVLEAKTAIRDEIYIVIIVDDESNQSDRAAFFDAVRAHYKGRQQEVQVKNVDARNNDPIDVDRFLSRIGVYFRKSAEEWSAEVDICNRLRDILRLTREQRTRKGHLWSLSTLTTLIEKFSSASKARPSSFNPVTALRETYWPGKSLYEQSLLTEWLGFWAQARSSSQVLGPVLAKVFLEDAKLLPHGFRPSEVFHELYRSLCTEALGATTEGSLWVRDITLNTLCDAVVRSIETWDGRTAAYVRKLWANSPCSTLCCMCIWNRPKVLFHCGHGLCERDAWRYSVRQRPFECISELLHCPACGAKIHCKIRLRPLQAGYRIATLDGGGVMGVVSLISLETVTKKLPVRLQVHHYFDLIVGTSTGSIIAAALGIQQWSLRRCIDEFAITADKVFQKSTPLVSLYKVIRCLWTGAKHSGASLYDALHNAFDSRSLSSQSKTVSDVRVAITATDSNGECRLSRSYALAKPPEGTLPGRLLVGKNIALAIAESCAAPFYFPPVEGRRDGGLVANNPSAVARTEARCLSGGQIPDYAASFGTGTFEPGLDGRTTGPYLVPQWLRSLGGCIVQTFNADITYARFRAQLTRHEKERYHRINPVLPCSGVALDDATAIPDLERMTRKHMTQDLKMQQQVSDLCLPMLSCMFYPIISSPPCFDPHTGLYDVTVVIVSRWEDDARTSRQLQDCLDGACFLVQGWQYKSITPLEVLVTLSSPGESLHIELQLRDGRRHHISGLPRSVEKVLSDQYKPEVDMPRWKITGRKRRSAGPASSPQERRNTKRARGCHLPLSIKLT